MKCGFEIEFYILDSKTKLTADASHHSSAKGTSSMGDDIEAILDALSDLDIDIEAAHKEVANG